MKRLLLIAFSIEVGFVLIVIPWSAFWDGNYFGHLLPPLRTLITNNFLRGAVSGLGVINITSGLLELFAIFAARRSDHPASINPSQLAKD